MKIRNILVGVVILILSSNLSMASDVPEKIPMPEPEMEYTDMDADFDRLQINPRYENFHLEPGDSDSVTFKVKNTGEEAIITKVKIEIPPFSEYIMDMDWVTVNPKSGTIGPGESMDFEVTIEIPEGTDRGYYGAQIAFTNDTYPSPYPGQFQNYINAAQLSVDVWVPPVVQILNQYIHDQIEAGKEYDYEIELKNTGTEPITIDPEMEDSRRYYDYGPYGMDGPQIAGDDITIESPGVINPGETARVKVHIKVPPDAKGYYNGAIDLNIDDPSIDDWQGQVQLDLQIWKQPAEAFVKTFNIDTDSPVTIDIISDMWDYHPGSGTSSKQEPGFDVNINGPGASDQGDIRPSRIVIGGSVDLGMEKYPPWEVESEGLYEETRTQYIETYILDGTVGDWTLSIMPYHTSRFEYKIQIGE